MKISVIGSGYVGLISAVGFAEVGHNVLCVDKRAEVVDSINEGIPPIHEDGLPEILSQHVPERIHATVDLKAAVSNSDVTFVAVGTPTAAGKIDLSFIEAAVLEIGEALSSKNSFHVVVIKSTVVPGTTDGLVTKALERASGKIVGKDIGIAMNPEFLREGVALHDFINPDRVVFGGDPRSIEILKRLYAPFKDTEIFTTTAITAELIKYCSNTFFAMLISYANEFANLSANCGADGLEVIKGLILDRRFNEDKNGNLGLLSYLRPGCGYGGSCFPKDVKAISAFGDSIGSPMLIASAVDQVNFSQVDKVIEMVTNNFDTTSKLGITVLGLSFKPNTDDVRESVGIKIANILSASFDKIFVCDALAKVNAMKELNANINWLDNLEEVIELSQILILTTLSDQFLKLPSLVKSLDQPPLVIDTRRSFDSSSFSNYSGIGYPHNPNNFFR